MTRPDPARVAGYAREQIAAADMILARHGARGSVCSCGRPAPCPQVLAVHRRRQYLAGRLAMLAPAVGRAAVPTVLPGQIVAVRGQAT